MATFTLKNKQGLSLPLTGAKNYKLVNIDSQTAATASISSVVIGGLDGDKVNNIQAQPRTIILDIRIIANVEETKREILKVLKLKQSVTLIWEQNDRTLTIEGVVEQIEMPRWTKSTLLQVSLHCEQPFWQTLDTVITEVSEVINLHYFTDYQDNMLYFLSGGAPMGEIDLTRTKSFINEGDIDVGVIIEILATRTVTNPIIYNADGQFFGAGHGTGVFKVEMQTGDNIVINTQKNEKSVTLNGESILNKVKPHSTWLQLEAGRNEFSIDSDDEDIRNMMFTMFYKPRYI